MSFTRQTLRTARAGPSVSRRSLATPASLPAKPCESITPPYPRLLETLKDVRNVLGRDAKLTLAEKILYSHLRNPEESLGGKGRVRGEKYLKLRPDRVAMQVSKRSGYWRLAVLSRTGITSILPIVVRILLTSIGRLGANGSAPVHDLWSPFVCRASEYPL